MYSPFFFFFTSLSLYKPTIFHSYFFYHNSSFSLSIASFLFLNSIFIYFPFFFTFIYLCSRVSFFSASLKVFIYHLPLSSSVPSLSLCSFPSSPFPQSLFYFLFIFHLFASSCFFSFFFTSHKLLFFSSLSLSPSFFFLSLVFYVYLFTLFIHFPSLT